MLDSWPPRLGRRQWVRLSVAAGVAGFVAVLSTTLADTDLAVGTVVALALAIGIAETLAMRVPMAGWALALSAVAAASVLARPQPELWVDPMLTGYFVVLASGAARAGPRTTAAGWVATVAVATGVALVLRPAEWLVGILGATAVAGLVLSTVIAVRTLGVTSSNLRREREATERQRLLTTRWEERARIARELHDVVAHHMTVIAIQAEVAKHSDPPPGPATIARLDTIRTGAALALGEMRQILGVLRGDAALLPQPTLRDLPELVDAVRASGTHITLTCTGETTTVTDALGLSAYRIVQEALSNATRHAPGYPVVVEVAVTEEEIEIRVTNPCPPAPADAGHGHGLLGMRERTAMLGGSFTAGFDGTKFRVTATLPLRAN